ncbi:MAG: threonine/serine dehydratase [Thermomicrobiales bacterium]
MTERITLTDVYRARSVVSRYLQPTPLLRSRTLSEWLECDLWVKYENCTPIRSFKGRGGIYRASTLGPDIAGMATASTGNHGQGIAWGAGLFGKRAVVVAPLGANPFKLAAMRALGAEVVEEGATLTESNEVAKRIAAGEGLLYVEDGEDPDVMLGCATLALELLEQHPDLDDLVVQLGGGNLIGACALVLGQAAPDVRLNGVQSSAAPASYESWKVGEPLVSPLCETFAGGVATSYPGHYTFQYWKSSIDTVHLVSDDELIDAAMVMLRETGHLPEGAGAAALAGILKHPERYKGRTVVALLSGGNAEPLIWDRLAEGATI